MPEYSAVHVNNLQLLDLINTIKSPPINVILVDQVRRVAYYVTCFMIAMIQANLMSGNTVHSQIEVLVKNSKSVTT